MSRTIKHVYVYILLDFDVNI